MIKVLVLVCSASVDHAHCQPGLAIDTIEAMRVNSLQQCAFQAQTMMARTALVPRRDEYMTIVCRPDRIASADP